MNYALKNIKIKSNWFERHVVKDIGYKGFSLYLNFFRFYVSRQEHEYTFNVTVAALRKELGYTSSEIVDLIKLLVKKKVIEISIIRWDRMYANGKLLDDKMFTVWACDKPQTTRIKINKNGKEIEIDKPNTKDDLYVSINLDLMENYRKLGLNERCYAIYALIKKLSNNTEGKCWMKINTMAEVLGYGDNYVHKLIHELNRKYLLFSNYRKIDGYTLVDGKKKRRTRFEHKILGNILQQEGFLKSNKENIDKNIRKWDKRSNKKQATNNIVEEDMEINGEIDNNSLVVHELEFDTELDEYEVLDEEDQSLDEYDLSKLFDIM